jgi:hypothetical protein
VRWDFDGNGKPDLKPGVTTDTPQESDYVSDLNPTISVREVGHKVTLWYTDPVFGDTVEIAKVVHKEPGQPGQPGSPAGGAR